jgi:hypothetical protein
MLLSGIGGGQVSKALNSPTMYLITTYLIPSLSKTLQTTTVAAQASVPRKDMAVVTAFRNFIRQLGGTLTLAFASTFM